MAKRNKPKRLKKRRVTAPRKPTRPVELTDQEILEDFIASVTCSRMLSNDIGAMCEVRLADLGGDVERATLGRDLWAGRPGRAGQLAQLIDELVSETERHRAAVRAIGQRIAVLADDETFDEHLDLELVDRDRAHQALFGPPIPPSAPVSVPGQVACQTYADLSCR